MCGVTAVAPFCAPPPTRVALVSGPVVVLKLGSSVLDGIDGYRGAAREIAAEVQAGRRVVAVVSAAPGVTDALLASARALHDEAPDELVSALAATGEGASSALLAIALAAAGVPAHVLDWSRLGLRTRGPHLDAEPVELETGELEARLRSHPAVVAPGFVGTAPCGRPSLLGRGGSDLSALFIAQRLGAAECRLVKDVDGVFPTDPNRSAEPVERYAQASWDRVLDVGGELVQGKAVRWARDHRVAFRVAALGGQGTWVGDARDGAPPR